MATKQDIALMAHLLRRAGFGATRAEIERRADDGYDETVEWLLSPDEQPEVDEYLLYRYHPDSERPPKVNHASVNWLYRMVNSERPLEEKMGLFWHQVFATGDNKVESAYEIQDQIGMFREHGLGNYPDLLVRLAQNPTMLYWLDNQENHKRAPNENWGRELMELFSLGIGNYTEKDVYEASRAFTGWAFDTKIHWLLWGPHLWNYEFHPENHDGTEKDYLGHSGKFDGFDVIDIIVRQPACHVFIARHLYNFFVEDEPQVPAWPIEPPRNPEAIRTICEAFVKNDYEIKPVLRTIFTSEFFKESLYKHVRNPAEVVAGTLRVTGALSEPHPDWEDVALEPMFMGQSLHDPPSVEGWHTGHEWINSGALVRRVNFMSDKFSDTSLPGVQDIIAASPRRTGPPWRLKTWSITASISWDPSLSGTRPGKSWSSTSPARADKSHGSPPRTSPTPHVSQAKSWL